MSIYARYGSSNLCDQWGVLGHRPGLPHRGWYFLFSGSFMVPSWLHNPRMILLELVRNDPPLWAGTSVVEQVLELSLQAVKSIPSNKGGSTHKNALETMTFAPPH